MTDTECRFRPAGAVRASVDRKLRVLAVPFGGPDDLDHLNEWMDRDTETWMKVGRTMPVTYFHGFTPDKKMTPRPNTIGEAIVTGMDAEGWWMEVDLDEGRMGDKMLQRAEAGTCRASTGAINYLCRPVDIPRFHKEPIYVEAWIVGELSLIDEGLGRHPVNDKAVALPLRAMYEAQELEFPKEFGENSEPEPAVSNPTTPFVGDTTMTEITEAVKAELDARDRATKAEADKVAAIRATILKELEGEPKSRAMFNVGGKVSGKDSKFAFRATDAETQKYDKEELEETSRFLYHLMRPLQAPAAMRANLEEHEAAEGGGLIPTPMLDRIVAMRDESSLVAKLGMTRLQTNSMTLRIPREDAGMGVFATIAEEGAYVANEPAFSAETVTVIKKGSLIGVTEEMLEDAAIFLPYFTQLCGRKYGLTENLILFTELKADATAGTHSATFTQPEIDAFMFQITEPWADGAHLICLQATMATIRGLLIATPRAYGGFPDFGGLAYPTLFGYPFHLNSNWQAVGGGDTFLTMSLVNPAAISWVERRGLSIKVDPYGDSLNGRVRYYPSFRAACATTQVLGNVSYTDHA